jgi:hypothetical protein
VVLGDCYTKGSEVRVSVGIKPETIASAGNLAGSISSSVANNRTPIRENPSPSRTSRGGATDYEAKSTGLQGRDSYSNTRRLDNF